MIYKMCFILQFNISHRFSSIILNMSFCHGISKEKRLPQYFKRQNDISRHKLLLL